MSADHLPECYWSSEARYPVCICDELRQAEQRINREWELAGKTGQYLRMAQSKSYAAGVTAAWDAVLGVSPKFWPYDPDNDAYPECITVDDALAAIDALRGDHV